jgi:hypothetical protein
MRIRRLTLAKEEEKEDEPGEGKFRGILSKETTENTCGRVAQAEDDDRETPNIYQVLFPSQPQLAPREMSILNVPRG